MIDWLSDKDDALSDQEMWDFSAASYNFEYLKKWLGENGVAVEESNQKARVERWIVMRVIMKRRKRSRRQRTRIRRRRRRRVLLVQARGDYWVCISSINDHIFNHV